VRVCWQLEASFRREKQLRRELTIAQQGAISQHQMMTAHYAKVWLLCSPHPPLPLAPACHTRRHGSVVTETYRSRVVVMADASDAVGA
jgi:hypothetical protein